METDVYGIKQKAALGCCVTAVQTWQLRWLFWWESDCFAGLVVAAVLGWWWWLKWYDGYCCGDMEATVVGWADGDGGCSVAAVKEWN